MNKKLNKGVVVGDYVIRIVEDYPNYTLSEIAAMFEPRITALTTSFEEAKEIASKQEVPQTITSLFASYNNEIFVISDKPVKGTFIWNALRDYTEEYGFYRVELYDILEMGVLSLVDSLSGYYYPDLDTEAIHNLVNEFMEDDAVAGVITNEEYIARAVEEAGFKALKTRALTGVF